MMGVLQWIALFTLEMASLQQLVLKLIYVQESYMLILQCQGFHNFCSG